MGDQLERTISALVDLYRKGTLKEELRPTTLIDLGGDFLKLYSAAFRRENRSEWSERRFPNGFADLVSDVNARLMADGVTILNTKLEPARYRMLPQERRKVIEMLQEAWKSGVIERSEAIGILERDFNISLSPTQRSYYFKEGENPTQLDDSLCERKRQLAIKVEKLKADLNLDLTIDHFLKGMMFEQLVGVFLTAHYDGIKLQRQRQFPVAYKDLNGQPHASVFVDFLLDDTIVEVKWRNSFDNIVSSALPQLYGYEQKFGFGGCITVVYRHPCPLMRVAYDANIRLTDEVEAMGLGALNDLARPIRDVLAYVSVEDLFRRNETLGPMFMALLAEVDGVADRSNSAELRQVTEILARIGSDINQLPTRVALLTERLGRGELFTDSQLKRFFGELPERGEEEMVSSDRRLKIMQRQISANRERLLLDLYELESGMRVFTLEEPQVLALEELATKKPERFADLALELLAAREMRHLDRLSKRRDAARDDSEVISAFDRVRARQRADRIVTLEREDAEWRGKIAPYLEQVDAAFQAYHGLKDVPGGPQAHAMKRLREWARGDSGKVAEMINTLHRLNPRFRAFRQDVGAFVHEEVPAALKRMYEAMGEFGPRALEIPGEIAVLIDQKVEALTAELAEFADTLQSDPLFASQLVFSARKAERGALYDKWADEVTRGELLLTHDRLLLDGVRHAFELLRQRSDEGLVQTTESVRQLYSGLDRNSESLGYPAVGAFNLGLALEAQTLDRLEREVHGIRLEGRVLEATQTGQLASPEFLRELLTGPNQGLFRSYARLMSKTRTVETKICPPITYMEGIFDRLQDALNPGDRKVPKFGLNADLIEHEVSRLRSDLFNRTGELLLATYSGMDLSRVAVKKGPEGIPLPTPVTIHVPRKFSPSQFEAVIMPQSAKVLGAMERGGLIGFHMLGDFLARKVAQGRVIAYFDDDLAYRFMAEHNPQREVCASLAFDLPAMRSALENAQRQSDETFRGLLNSGA